MKKISLIILIALVLTLGLTACAQTLPTARVARWYNDERYEFYVSKADLDPDPDGNYSREYAVRGEANPNQMDEVVPEDLAGSFVMEVKVNKDTNQCTFTTEMELISLYTDNFYAQLADSIKADLENAGLVLSTAEKAEYFNNQAGVAIKATTSTSVIFQNDKAQRPIESKKVINGYYFGATQKEVTASTTVVNYNLDNKKVTVKVDDQEAVEREIKFNANLDIIDANQLLLYIRSLQKDTNSFKDNPSVQVYDPIYNVVRSAAFSMTSSCQTYVYYQSELIPVKLNCVAAVVDGQVFMVQMNLPDSLNNAESQLDVIKDASSTFSKYTTVRFRTGIKSFELKDYDTMLKDTNGNAEGAQIVEALRVAAAKK